MDSQLQIRLVTAGVLILVLLGLGYLATQIPFAHFLLLSFGFLALGLACGEYAKLLQRENEDFFSLLFTLFTLLAPALIQFVLSGNELLEIRQRNVEDELIFAVCSSMFSFCVGVFFLAVHAIARSRGKLDDMLSFLGARFAALFHVGAGGASALALLGISQGVFLLFWLVLVVCMNDAAAYFIGKSFGKTPFAPVISPKKTWEGSLAGLLAGLCTGLFSCPLIGLPWFSWRAFLLCLFVLCFAQMGDLLKSLLKRRAGEKDSGTLLPGHGGVLDRIDASLLASLPFLYFLLSLR